MPDPMRNPDVLRSRLIELADMAERTAHMIGSGLHGYEAHEIERAMRAIDALRTPLLDIQNTNRRSPTHPYALAMAAHDGGTLP